MPVQKENIRLSDWKDDLLANGRISFSLDQAKEAFPAHTETAIKRSLNRLSVKGDIVSIYKGYYLIISSQYASRGILPPTIYIEALMKYLKRPYYMGLLNAAAFHGAAHQQPQEFFVFTSFPVLRDTKRKGIRVNYISIKKFPTALLEERKTESGYLKVSSPELTVIDLIHFEKRVGGLDRVTTVLNELTDEIKPEKLNGAFLKEVSAVSVQRLGFILEKVLEKTELAEQLYESCKKEKIKFNRKPLKASGKVKGFQYDEKWKIIINTNIEHE